MAEAGTSHWLCGLRGLGNEARRSTGASMSLQPSQAMFLFSLQAEISFLQAARCTHTRNVPGCVHACTCPARNRVSGRIDVLPVHPCVDRKEKQPQNLLILGCCKHGTCCGPKSHDQLPEQLLYPGSVLLPFTPSTAPPKSTSQHPQQGQWWWHYVAPCSSATTKDRAGESSTQSWRNLHPAPALPHCSALILAWQPMPGSHRFYPRSAKLLHPQAVFRDWHANKLTAASDCDN